MIYGYDYDYDHTWGSVWEEPDYEDMRYDKACNGYDGYDGVPGYCDVTDYGD